jgi:hypothetical protein
MYKCKNILIGDYHFSVAFFFTRFYNHKHSLTIARSSNLSTYFVND